MLTSISFPGRVYTAFPQIIVKGELIGGLDILKELIASGEFAELIQGI